VNVQALIKQKPMRAAQGYFFCYFRQFHLRQRRGQLREKRCNALRVNVSWTETWNFFLIASFMMKFFKYCQYDMARCTICVSCAKALLPPRQNFILAEFKLSLPRPGSCGSEKSHQNYLLRPSNFAQLC